MDFTQGIRILLGRPRSYERENVGTKKHVRQKTPLRNFEERHHMPIIIYYTELWFPHSFNNC